FRPVRRVCRQVFFGVGFARQYALRFTLPLSSFDSATQLQSLRASQPDCAFRALHAVFFAGAFGSAFFSCACAPNESIANAAAAAVVARKRPLRSVTGKISMS